MTNSEDYVTKFESPMYMMYEEAKQSLQTIVSSY